MKAQSNARAAALKALERCRKDKAWSSASIDAAVKAYSLDKRDTALAARLSLGVLQNSSYCDYYIDLFSGGKKLEPKLRDILRLGVYQLLLSDKIPPSAAVNESVKLAKSSGLAHASGLVNALLRKIADARDSLPEISGEGTAEYLCVKYSHPMWLIEKIISEHDYSFAEAFAASNNRAPALSIQLNTLKTELTSYLTLLDEAGIEYTLPVWPKDSISLKGGSVQELPGFDEGLFYVQDRAARRTVDISEVKAGMRVLDACSAPGGKSFAAALLMGNCGSILSCDIHEKKLALIRSGAERLGIDIIETTARDARETDDTLLGSFDLVIADVPCSGLGVIAKKPEIRHKDPETLKGLPAIQSAILESLSRYVKSGGTLIYSTCTVLRDENEAVVEDFISRHRDFILCDFPVGERCSTGGMYTFWPHINGTDGFFAAKMKKV